ncbi:MAG: hypothetical protein JXR03_13340 [Cyclobacteriaceae bacterium]
MDEGAIRVEDNDKYLPVDPDFHEIVQEKINAGELGKVHFFENQFEIGVAQGVIKELKSLADGFFVLVGKDWVRLDKIITLLGRPGPSYETYDRFANACLTCENLGQFGV